MIHANTLNGNVDKMNRQSEKQFEQFELTPFGAIEYKEVAKTVNTNAGNKPPRATADFASIFKSISSQQTGKNATYKDKK